MVAEYVSRLGHGQVQQLKGRVALVTGAGRGIGRAIAERLAAEGAAVVANDLDEASLADVMDGLGSGNVRAIAVAGSVTNVSDCARMVEGAEATFGGLDIVVNNAGITADAWLHRMSDETWALVNDVVLKGTFQVCRAAARLLRVPKGVEPKYHRKVVNISSINGIYGVAGNTNYSAAKAGVIGFTRALAREWAPQRINVNAIAPGFVGGTRLTAIRVEGDTLGIPADALDRIRRSIPIGREGTPGDIAGVVNFLVSPDSDYVTGQVIEAHGGLEIVSVA